MRDRRLATRVVGALAAVVYSSFLVSHLFPTDRSIDFVSELERSGAPYAGWYRASDAVAGVLMIALAVLCSRGLRSLSNRQDNRRAIRWALIAVALVGASSVLDSLSPMDCNPSVQSMCDISDQGVTGLLRQLLVGHTLSGLVGFGAAGIGAAWCARAAWLERAAHLDRAADAARTDKAATAWMRVHIVLAAVVGLCGLGDLVLLLVGADVGLVERVRIVVVSLWIATVPWTARVCASPARSHAHGQVRRSANRASLSTTTHYGGNGHDQF